MFNLKDYDYRLPQELIAKKPKDRGKSKLLAFNRERGKISHLLFEDIVDKLNENDLLVINNTKVIPARIFGQKETGGKIELLIIEITSYEKQIAKCLIKASKRLAIGSFVFFENDKKGEILSFNDKIYEVQFFFEEKIEDALNKIGFMPLPPYIKRDDKSLKDFDKKRYQTIYAKEVGAIAAPTAGLHFSPEILNRIRKKIEVVSITLHVSYGTFAPVEVSDIRQHKLHTEKFKIKKDVASALNKAKKDKKRIIAVGTTCTRCLEYLASKNDEFKEEEGECNIFIYPGYKFKITDAIITNFHLPQSTLLMLISAFAGREQILDLYNIAIKNNYFFFSYGDSMFIE